MNQVAEARFILSDFKSIEIVASLKTVYYQFIISISFKNPNKKTQTWCYQIVNLLKKSNRIRDFNFIFA
jgi:hypothetical protein